MSAMMAETWLVARNSETRWRCSCGKTTLKRLSNEKNTEVAMQARNITHSIEFLAMMRSACAYGATTSVRAKTVSRPSTPNSRPAAISAWIT